MDTVFLIINQINDNVLGYVATFEEALKIINDGDCKYRYSEIPSSEINGVEQTCYENIYNV